MTPTKALTHIHTLLRHHVHVRHMTLTPDGDLTIGLTSRHQVTTARDLLAPSAKVTDHTTIDLLGTTTWDLTVNAGDLHLTHHSTERPTTPC